MARPTPQKIDIQSPIRDLRIDYIPDTESWRIWITANRDWSLGTFIHLHREGDIARVTWHADGTETVHE